MQTIAKLQERMGTYPTGAHAEYRPAPGGKTMRALAWFGKDDVRIIDAPIPDITEPDDVILQVTGTSICGSDLHLYHGEIEQAHGRTASGSVIRHRLWKVRILQAEAIVVFLQNSMYGQRNAGIFGFSHLTGGFPGGQAEYVRVPFGSINLLPIPDDVPDEKALYLSDVLPTSYHTVVDTGVKKGDVVGIWGLGPIGQCAGYWYRLCAREKLGIETIGFREYTDVPKGYTSSYQEVWTSL
ncbi:hypothetical protein AAF712_007990 [Marasmius tenuissimus]|uniref:Alcohol dehydrogenase-like N-terminal domain-containing protein n=1 Tax=Marasmius tenuissimus TaxID=585030 RepID=A0ABR2ZV18_9AGAR